MDDLVDLIYECALLPELWPGTLDRLSRIANARGGMFLSFTTARLLGWTSSSSIRPDLAKFVNSALLLQTRRQFMLHRLRHPGFSRDEDMAPPEVLESDPMYKDFLLPIGLGRATGTSIQMPNGEIVVLSLERERALGPVEPDAVRQLDALRPHIARSALLSARLQLQRARLVADTLAMIGWPALVVNDEGKVVAANTLIEALKTIVDWRARDRFSLKDAAADALLRQAIQSIDQADSGVRSFAIRDSGATAAMVGHVVPIRGAARDLFTRCAAVLVLTPVAMPKGPSAELIQSLFDLTPAEARVARSITAGETVDAIAAENNVSQNTVRTQLRGVMEKTGCRRQAEVASLLGGIPTLGSVAPAP